MYHKNSLSIKQIKTFELLVYKKLSKPLLFRVGPQPSSMNITHQLARKQTPRSHLKPTESGSS